MRRLPTLLRLITFGSLLALPFPAYATGADIGNMFLNLVTVFVPIVIPIAILVVVISGFILMTSQDEAALTKAQSAIIAAAIGGIIATIIVAVGPLNFISNLYNGVAGYFINPVTGGDIGWEARGIADWLATMAAMGGIVTIIVAVLRAAASFGGDEAAYSAVRNSILHVIIGFIIIGGAYIFELVFFVDREPSPLLLLIQFRVEQILFVITTIAVAILIYAGLRMVISFGKEDEFTSAKSLAIRVVIGLAIVLLSYVLVNGVVLLFNGTLI
ncbi:MAG: hypothetical protein WC840_00040 [Candidatus Peribacteraceae bacterium]